MGVFKSILPDDDDRTIFECRTCGTTVDHENAACPYCGFTDVVRYDLS